MLVSPQGVDGDQQHIREGGLDFLSNHDGVSPGDFRPTDSEPSRAGGSADQLQPALTGGKGSFQVKPGVRDSFFMSGEFQLGERSPVLSAFPKDFAVHPAAGG